MGLAAEQIDRKLKKLHPLAQTVRPARGWVRAIRDALGMTTRQLGKRLGVSQPRIVVLEKAEVTGNVTLESLERAASAMGCRVVYAFVPQTPLTGMLKQRARRVAERHLASVEQTMRLEGQSVSNPKLHASMRKKLVEELIQRPARLWDQP